MSVAVLSNLITVVTNKNVLFIYSNKYEFLN